MDAAIYKAVSGAVVQMHRLEVVAQDLGNINTTGYKGQRLAFGEVLGTYASASERSGGWVAISGSKTNLTSGETYSTGNNLHLAIAGDGYFVVQTPRGERYTRNGSFTLKGDGTVTTPAGDPLLLDSGPFQLTGTMRVSSDGVVSDDTGEIGNLKIARFVKSQQVVKEGSSLMQALPGSVAAANAVQILQGSLEQSNVSPIDNMVLLITNQRHFEAYERAIKMMDGTTEKMIAEAAR